jgi:hypothetical protein
VQAATSFGGGDNWPTNEEVTTIPEVILCSPYKPEMEAHLKQLELLTQEFNPDQEDFEDDAHQDDESKDVDDQGALILSGSLAPWKSCKDMQKLPLSSLFILLY